MRRMESALWSAVEMGDLSCGSERRGGVLNKAAADPTGAPIAPAVTAANRHGI